MIGPRRQPEAGVTSSLMLEITGITSNPCSEYSSTCRRSCRSLNPNPPKTTASDPSARIVAGTDCAGFGVAEQSARTPAADRHALSARRPVWRSMAAAMAPARPTTLDP